jgi:hypothetical protein
MRWLTPEKSRTRKRSADKMNSKANQSNLRENKW